MKRLVIILLGIMLSSCSLGYYSNDGMGLTTTANIALQPAWGPAGYDCAHYYYFPDFNFYYDVDNALFYYLSGSRWISARQLPYTLGYPRDLYKFYKVVLNIRDPWKHNRRHRTEYKHFRGMHHQPVLRDTRPNHKPQPAYRPQQGNRPPQNGYRPSQGNNNRPPQNGYKPQQENRPPQAKPQGNNYGYDNRNTIRGSRNNNTSRNTVAPNKPNNGTGNKVQQTPQRPKPQGNQSSRTNARSNNSNKGKATVSGSRENETSKSKSNTRSSGSSSSSSKGRSTGSRGR